VNKQELIIELANKSGLGKEKIAEFIESFIGTIKDSLRRGDEVNISGLGIFMLLKRQAYTGKNPQTGEKIEVPEQILPYFRASRILKESIK
jgi:nucleoid DNA-binding protein